MEPMAKTWPISWGSRTPIWTEEDGLGWGRPGRPGRAGGKCLPRRKFCNDVFNARYARNLGTMFKNQIIQNVMIAIWLVSWRWRWRDLAKVLLYTFHATCFVAFESQASKGVDMSSRQSPNPWRLCISDAAPGVAVSFSWFIPEIKHGLPENPPQWISLFKPQLIGGLEDGFYDFQDSARWLAAELRAEQGSRESDGCLDGQPAGKSTILLWWFPNDFPLKNHYVWKPYFQ